MSLGHETSFWVHLGPFLPFRHMPKAAKAAKAQGVSPKLTRYNPLVLRHPHWDHTCRGQPFKMASNAMVEFQAQLFASGEADFSATPASIVRSFSLKCHKCLGNFLIQLRHHQHSRSWRATSSGAPAFVVRPRSRLETWPLSPPQKWAQPLVL